MVARGKDETAMIRREIGRQGGHKETTGFRSCWGITDSQKSCDNELTQ
jgi:hypothetical protein